jgi:hypothetical protein
MSTRNQTHDITRIPRAVLSVAVGVVHTVERATGAQVRTARGNAWEAVCADRARALEQAEVRRRLEGLRLAPAVSRRAQSAVGSSPRSSASQTLLAAGRASGRS